MYINSASAKNKKKYKKINQQNLLYFKNLPVV